MAHEYKSVTVQAGQLSDRCNELAAEDFSVSNIVKDGNHFYILFEKYIYVDEDDSVESESNELWTALVKVQDRLQVLEGALALKIQAEATEEVEPPVAE